MKYIIVQSFVKETVEKEVNEKLKEGWILVGGVSESNDGWSQAMVKNGE